MRSPTGAVGLRRVRGDVAEPISGGRLDRCRAVATMSATLRTMTTVPMSDDVTAALEESRRLGFLGARPIEEVVTHARAFVDALDGVVGQVADLGAGGGVPGFVIAHDRPDLELLLIDRRAKRTDFLARMVRRLRWTERIQVLTADVEQIVRSSPASVDAVVARGFGPPEPTLSLAVGLVRPGGRVIISEPPSGDRWPPDLLVELGVSREFRTGSTVAVFHRDGFT